MLPRRARRTREPRVDFVPGSAPGGRPPAARRWQPSARRVAGALRGRSRPPGRLLVRLLSARSRWQPTRVCTLFRRGRGPDVRTPPLERAFPERRLPRATRKQVRLGPRSAPRSRVPYEVRVAREPLYVVRSLARCRRAEARGQRDGGARREREAGW